ncbi:hypothetical protein K440DRAFT_626001 [Wilcoxina mikolae CBS 423.85]|nr:hypothetical protein K440DRAFT_626001 [Wilcoxina mikolae CBS 423.85]
MQAPYFGPPIYDNIARRFSPSQVDPQVLFTCKLQQEAKDRCEFVDIMTLAVSCARMFLIKY